MIGLTQEEIIEIEAGFEKEVIREGAATALFPCVHHKNTRCANYVACDNCVLKHMTTKSMMHINLNGITLVW